MQEADRPKRGRKTKIRSLRPPLARVCRQWSAPGVVTRPRGGCRGIGGLLAPEIEYDVPAFDDVKLITSCTGPYFGPGAMRGDHRSNLFHFVPELNVAGTKSFKLRMRFLSLRIAVRRKKSVGQRGECNAGEKCR